MARALNYQSQGPKFKTNSLKVDLAFHPSEVDQMTTRNSWGLSG